MDDVYLWRGHQPGPGARTPAIVQVCFVLLDSRQPSATEVPMRLVGLVIAGTLVAWTA